MVSARTGWGTQMANPWVHRSSSTPKMVLLDPDTATVALLGLTKTKNAGTSVEQCVLQCVQCTVCSVQNANTNLTSSVPMVSLDYSLGLAAGLCAHTPGEDNTPCDLSNMRWTCLNHGQFCDWRPFDKIFPSGADSRC